MKLDTVVALCKRNYYSVGSDSAVLEEGDLCEIISHEGGILRVWSERAGSTIILEKVSKHFPNEHCPNAFYTWPYHFETDSKGILREFQLTEKLF